MMELRPRPSPGPGPGQPPRYRYWPAIKLLLHTEPELQTWWREQLVGRAGAEFRLAEQLSAVQSEPDSSEHGDLFTAHEQSAQWSEHSEQCSSVPGEQYTLSEEDLIETVLQNYERLQRQSECLVSSFAAAEYRHCSSRPLQSYNTAAHCSPAQLQPCNTHISPPLSPPPPPPPLSSPPSYSPVPPVAQSPCTSGESAEVESCSSPELVPALQPFTAAEDHCSEQVLLATSQRYGVDLVSPPDNPCKIICLVLPETRYLTVRCAGCGAPAAPAPGLHRTRETQNLFPNAKQLVSHHYRPRRHHRTNS